MLKAEWKIERNLQKKHIKNVFNEAIQLTEKDQRDFCLRGLLANDLLNDEKLKIT